MGDVHLNVFFGDFIEAALRHGIDMVQRWLEEHYPGEFETVLGEIQLPDFAGETVDFAKQILMDVGKSGEGSNLGFFDIAGVIKQLCLLLADLLLFPCQPGLVGDAEFVLQNPAVTPMVFGNPPFDGSMSVT